MNRIELLIKTLGLLPHPEGGYYKETYRSEILSDFHNFPAKRNVSTGIYFLLDAHNFSALHRIKSDELWHFYEGSSLTIHEINQEGDYFSHQLGSDLEKGETYQICIPAGSWFGASVNNTEGYSLVGCTVAPGFDFSDFEMGTREQLIKDFPLYKKQIIKLTR